MPWSWEGWQVNLQAEGTAGTAGGAGDWGDCGAWVEWRESLGDIFLLLTYLIYSLSSSWKREAWLLPLAGLHTTVTGLSSTGPCVDGDGSAQVGWEHLQKSPALWVPGQYSNPSESLWS